MASGDVNRTNRPNTWLCSDHCCTREESPCQPGAVHTWPDRMLSETLRTRYRTQMKRACDRCLTATVRNYRFVFEMACHNSSRSRE